MADILEKVVIFLEEAESFIVPVKLVWKMLGEEYPGAEISIEKLTEKLKQDKRFKLFDGPENFMKNKMGPMIPEGEMEKLGFYRGPRVMLKGRIPTRKEVITFLLKKADQTFETLKKAWEIRPDGDETTEDQLLEALAKAQRLQRDLRAILSQNEEKSGEIASDFTPEGE
jgi:hypothetical protein